MAALGELRRRGSHQKRKPSARRLRAPLAALAAIAAMYTSRAPAPSSLFHRPRTDEEKAQERKKLARPPSSRSRGARRPGAVARRDAREVVVYRDDLAG